MVDAGLTAPSTRPRLLCWPSPARPSGWPPSWNGSHKKSWNRSITEVRERFFLVGQFRGRNVVQIVFLHESICRSFPSVFELSNERGIIVESCASCWLENEHESACVEFSPVSFECERPDSIQGTVLGTVDRFQAFQSMNPRPLGYENKDTLFRLIFSQFL